MIARPDRRELAERFDLVVVGGGIQGACVLLEAARRGWRTLLVERADFGGATSRHALRILHGGLRSLQHLRVRQARRSILARRWFCRAFPDQLQRLSCLMPLHGIGLKRPAAFRLAFALDAWLGHDAREGVAESLRPGPGRILDPAETIERFPGVPREGLQGAACWDDALMHAPQRLLMEVLHWACGAGGRAWSYCEATGLQSSAGEVTALEVVDRRDGRRHAIPTRAVANCSGPWVRRTCAALDRDVPALFPPTLAWNLLLDRPAPSDAALAVQPRRRDGQVYFLVPCRGRVLAGTGHAPWSGGVTRPAPTSEQVAGMLADLAEAVPALDPRPESVLRVHGGLLAAEAPGSTELQTRQVVHDHGRHGGPRGLLSPCCVKFTRAIEVAESVAGLLAERLPERPPSASPERQQRPPSIDLLDQRELLDGDPARLRPELARLVEEEAAPCLDDLLLRRTDWDCGPVPRSVLRERLAAVLRGLPPSARPELSARPRLAAEPARAPVA